MSKIVKPGKVDHDKAIDQSSDVDMTIDSDWSDYEDGDRSPKEATAVANGVVDLTAMAGLPSNSSDAYSKSSIAQHGHPKQRRKLKQTRIFRTPDGPRCRTLSSVFRPQTHTASSNTERPAKRVRFDEGRNEVFALPRYESSPGSPPADQHTGDQADNFDVTKEAAPLIESARARWDDLPDDEIAGLEPPRRTGTLVDTMNVTKLLQQKTIPSTPPRGSDSVNPHSKVSDGTPSSTPPVVRMPPPITPPSSNEAFHIPPNPYLPRWSAPHRLSNCSQLIPPQFRVGEALALLNAQSARSPGAAAEAFYLYATITNIDPATKVLKLSDIYTPARPPFLYAKYFPVEVTEDDTADELVCGQEHFQELQRQRQRPTSRVNSSHNLRAGMMIRLLLVARPAFQSTTLATAVDATAGVPSPILSTPVSGTLANRTAPPTPVSPGAAARPPSTAHAQTALPWSVGKTLQQAVDCFWLTAAADWDEVHALTAARISKIDS